MAAEDNQRKEQCNFTLEGDIGGDLLHQPLWHMGNRPLSRLTRKLSQDRDKNARSLFWIAIASCGVTSLGCVREGAFIHPVRSDGSSPRIP